MLQTEGAALWKLSGKRKCDMQGIERDLGNSVAGDKEESVCRELGEGARLIMQSEATLRHVDFVLKQRKAFPRYLLSKFCVSRLDETLGIRREASEMQCLPSWTLQFCAGTRHESSNN